MHSTSGSRMYRCIWDISTWTHCAALVWIVTDWRAISYSSPQHEPRQGSSPCQHHLSPFIAIYLAVPEAPAEFLAMSSATILSADTLCQFHKLQPSSFPDPRAHKSHTWNDPPPPLFPQIIPVVCAQLHLMIYVIFLHNSTQLLSSQWNSLMVTLGASPTACSDPLFVVIINQIWKLVPFLDALPANVNKSPTHLPVPVWLPLMHMIVKHPGEVPTANDSWKLPSPVS